MKTFATIIGTMVVTLVVVCAGFMYFAFDNGIITVSQRDQKHTMTVMVDGEVSSERAWTEVLGYNVSVNLDEAAYIGR